MGSISNVPNGINYLTQFVGSVANLPSSQNIGKILQSASPTEAAQISQDALQLQETNGILGLPTNQSTTADISLPGGASGAALPSGVSTADIANATPNQQATIAEQAQQLQQVQNMFYPPLSTPNNVNVLG